MITNAYKALLKRLRTVTVYVHAESFVDGEYVETVSSSGTYQMAIVPITAKQLRYLPDGVYDTQDKKFYQIGDGAITEKSTIQITAGDVYRVKDINNRYYDGGFTVYFGKKEK
jgi:hypothetical protein